MNPLKAATRFWKMRSSWLGDGGQPVPQAKADARSLVCGRCPFNNPHRSVWEAIAELGSSELRRQVELKARMKLVAIGEDALHICDGCHCLLPLKVWAPLKHIAATTPIENLHGNCWIRSELAT